MEQKNEKITVYKLKHQRQKKIVQEDPLVEMCLYVALKYPQYTFTELYECLPSAFVKKLYNTAQKDRAQTLLLLNSIINGPNEKSQSKKNYRDTIRSLIDVLEL